MANSRVAVPSTAPPAAASVGALLRHWRTARRLSQLELALNAKTSARHLSYVETGRSLPSREMVLRLADVLDVPLRERNALLVAAGFAPRYVETDLGAPALAQMRDAIDLVLRHHEPYPAFVLDRHWDIRMANCAASRCTRYLLGAESTERNMIRLVTHPNGLRPMLVNWREIAGDLLRHLHRHIATSPGDRRAAELLAEVLSYPDIPEQWHGRDLEVQPAPLLTTHFRKGEVELKFFATITTFGTPYDLTLEELHIECNYPADAATAATCRRLFA